MWQTGEGYLSQALLTFKLTMRNKFLISTILCLLLSILINYLSHKDLLVSLVNSITLTLSVYIFYNYINSKNSFLNSLIISFPLIPLFSYLPNNTFISFLPLLSLGIINLYIRFPKKWILVIWALFLLLGGAYSGEIIKYPFDVQDSQLIFNSPEINYNIQRHQQDAMFLPFKARQIIYSKLIIGYAALNNFFDFLNLKNLSDILLIANLYPLFVGMYRIFGQKNSLWNIFLITFLITVLIAGIDRSPDKFQSLYLLGPVFIYLIILGINKLNRKVYFALWILTFLILISPKI